jgi:hypothetical protein
MFPPGAPLPARPGQQADIVRVPPPSSASPGQHRSLLRKQGMAGAIMACYVFGLAFLQLGLMSFGKKSVLDSC